MGDEGKPVPLGLLDWNGDLEVELLVLEKREVETDTPGETVFETVEVRRFVGFNPAKFYLLGIDRGRLALCELRFTGPKTCAFVPVRAEKEGEPVLVRGDPRDLPPFATIEPEKGLAHFRLAIPTRSAATGDAFLVEFTLRVRAAKKGLAGPWRETK